MATRLLSKQLTRETSDSRRVRRAVIADRRKSSIASRDQSRAIEEAAKAERRRRRALLLTSKYPKQGVVQLKRIFDEYDTNSDGSISRTEWTTALAKQKATATRFDGRQETLAQRQARLGWVPGQAHDVVGVFLVDFSESLFRTLDLNDDSHIEFEEVLKVIYPLATPSERCAMLGWVAPPADDESDDEPTEEERRAEEAREAELAKMFEAYDRNHDGKISLAEFKAGLQTGGWEDDELREIFAGADTSGDGVIDLDEFKVLMWDNV